MFRRHLFETIRAYLCIVQQTAYPAAVGDEETTMFESLTRMAEARARRRTEAMLDQLPLEVQKDIGWRWSPARREPATPKLPDWNY